MLTENKSGVQLLEYIKTSESDASNFHPISSAYAIIRTEGKYLLGFNIYRKQWELPAGKLNTGETPREAAIRELYEETHQKCSELSFEGLFKIYDVKNAEFRYRSVFYGELEKLQPFIQEGNDEMEKILLWDTKKNIGYVDEVDVKMLHMVECGRVAPAGLL